MMFKLHSQPGGDFLERHLISRTWPNQRNSRQKRLGLPRSLHLDSLVTRSCWLWSWLGGDRASLSIIYRAATYRVLGFSIRFLELLEKRRGFDSVSQLPCDYGKTIDGSGIAGIQLERDCKILAGLIVPSHVAQQFAHLVICFGRVWIDSESLFEQRNT